jgi:FMN reductase
MTLTIVIGAATRPGRLHRAVAEAAGRGPARHPSQVLEIVDLGTLRIPAADGRPAADHGADLVSAIDAVTGADAVIFASPVYRASFTGVLKNYLDHLPADGLLEVPTGIVTMGGSDHHYLGADRHLRDVLNFFGALTAPTSVYLTPPGFDEAGAPTPSTAHDLDALIDTLVTLATRLADGPGLGPPPLALRGR